MGDGLAIFWCAWVNKGGGNVKLCEFGWNTQVHYVFIYFGIVMIRVPRKAFKEMRKAQKIRMDKQVAELKQWIADKENAGRKKAAQ